MAPKLLESLTNLQQFIELHKIIYSFKEKQLNHNIDRQIWKKITK